MAYWAVIPAAGCGSRMGAELPKQYLPLLDSTVIERTLERIYSQPYIDGVVVAVAGGDSRWAQIERRLETSPMVVSGGAERINSVLNALQRLADVAAADDWVLVHDAVRPCVRGADIERLIDVGSRHPVGALLGIPITDTVKRTDAGGTVIETVSREGLWRAATPQLFRLAELADALQSVSGRTPPVTDEASAMELCGRRPCVVPSAPDNIKVTRPEDLALAELFLTRQEQGA